MEWSLKELLKLPLIVAAVFVVLRVIMERAGAPGFVNSALSVVVLHTFLGPLYFAILIGRSGKPHPYRTLFSAIFLYVIFTRAMILPTYWLARILRWPESRFAGLADSSPFVGFIGIPFGTAALWIVFSLVIGGAIGTVVVTIVRSTARPSKSIALFIVGIGISLGTLYALPADASTTLDETVPPGDNYDKAEFRLWIPEGDGVLRAVLLLVPGSNGDGRPEAEDAGWQAFANAQRLALIGCRFTDKPHDQNFIEEYVNVSHGSGQALETALRSLGERSGHPELASVPLLLWGMSAGGEFNYEFVAWKPERVAAFVVNKGGIYYSALLPQAARNVPGILFIGGKDLESRISTITGLFAVNRRAGALWALAEEPSAAHIVGRSMELAKIFFDDVLSARLSTSSMKRLSEKEGFIGDPREKAFHPPGTAPLPNYSTAWLPTARVARAWQAMITEKPFEP
jgi:hypothetical protein